MCAHTHIHGYVYAHLRIPGLHMFSHAFGVMETALKLRLLRGKVLKSASLADVARCLAADTAEPNHDLCMVSLDETMIYECAHIRIHVYIYIYI